jgi:hypothetical protein
MAAAYWAGAVADDCRPPLLAAPVGRGLGLPAAPISLTSMGRKCWAPLPLLACAPQKVTLAALLPCQGSVWVGNLCSNFLCLLWLRDTFTSLWQQQQPSRGCHPCGALQCGTAHRKTLR